MQYKCWAGAACEVEILLLMHCNTCLSLAISLASWFSVSCNRRLHMFLCVWVLLNCVKFCSSTSYVKCCLILIELPEKGRFLGIEMFPKWWMVGWLDVTCLPVYGPAWFQAVTWPPPLSSVRKFHFSPCRVGGERTRASARVEIIIVCVHFVLFTNVCWARSVQQEWRTEDVTIILLQCDI